ncbi:hypothetical protein [Flavobacterium limi]|uniref:PH domain-containing protein n=1 Tax=Flavobacterium limi TaxID=2045105 RepID=A0ABQ1UDM2_9FLAO|nr:hypothetical protein [Flavobacterium limi]GGF16600.1 hypothetical protein GCM10011518_27540 [Flavobacterium limi]
MNKIEIRQRKKILLLFLLITTVIIVVTGFGVFFSEKYKENTTTKISFFIGVVLFCCFMYSPVRKLMNNQAIIIFDTDSIILNTNFPVTIKTKEIEGLSVTYVDEKGYFLNIKTKETTHETNISWLDKTPDEIKELIKVYEK